MCCPFAHYAATHRIASHMRWVPRLLPSLEGDDACIFNVAYFLALVCSVKSSKQGKQFSYNVTMEEGEEVLKDLKRRKVK